MYSVKPGRGPSLMGAVGGVVVAVGGVIWIVIASSIGAPGVFVLFGVLFVFMAMAGVAYNLYNASQKNRMSTFDITTGSEESDPIAQAMGHAPPTSSHEQTGHGKARKYEGDFCPFCGAKASQDFDYCPKCGKDI